MPLTPDCTATTFTGARQSGCVGVAVGVGLEDSVVDDVAVPVRDCELLGGPVLEAVGVVLNDRVAELLDVPLRVAELLGVDVPVGVGVVLNERVAELLGVSVRVLAAVTLGVGELLGGRVPNRASM